VSLFAELKRRNVFRVLAAYVVMSWLLLQIVDVVSPLLELPDTFAKGVLVLLGIGFVPAVVFSWIYELTPEGIKKESEIDRSKSIGQRTAKRLDMVVIAMLVAVAGLFFLDRPASRDTLEPSAEGVETATPGEVEAEPAHSDDEKLEIEKSIAVLPFVNMSGNTENEYFSDGLTETLLHMLAQVPELKVAARTSSFAFKGKEADVREIAGQLDVANILEGSVQRSGNQVRITAQLIQASSGFHLWSATYDRELDNLFAVQDEIAAEVSKALMGSLLGNTGPSTTGGTSSTEAYDLYLQAAAARRKQSERDLLESERLLRKALLLDEDFALAWTALAETMIDHARAAGLNRDDLSADILMVARRAVDLAPDVSATLTGLGYAHLFARDNASAREVLERAIVLNPNDAWAFSRLKNAYFSAGDQALAIQAARKAIALDPLDLELKLESTNLFINIDNSALQSLANIHYRTGDYSRAIEVYLRILDINPNYAGYQQRIALMLRDVEQDELAHQWVDQVEELDPPTSYFTRFLLCSRQGDDECTREAAHKQIERGGEFATTAKALVARLDGDHELALNTPWPFVCCGRPGTQTCWAEKNCVTNCFDK
jgi:TolB-like protein